MGTQFLNFVCAKFLIFINNVYKLYKSPTYIFLWLLYVRGICSFLFIKKNHTKEIKPLVQSFRADVASSFDLISLFPGCCIVWPIQRKFTTHVREWQSKINVTKE